MSRLPRPSAPSPILLVLVLSQIASTSCRTAPPSDSSPGPTAPSERPRAPSSPSPGATEPRSALAFVERTTGGASASETLPMIVAIHGMGDRPENFMPPWERLRVKARVVAPRGPRSWGSGFSWFTYPPKSEAAASSEILDAARMIADGMRAWTSARPTKDKPIVTGFSQGGFLSFAIAVHFPDSVAAALPVSGGMPGPLVPDAADAASAPPIFAMHGDADPIVPIERARGPVAKLRSLGFKVELEEYPGVEHTVNAKMWRSLQERIEKLLGG